MCVKMSPIPIATVLLAFLSLGYATSPGDNGRLPLHVKPINYKINITPYLNEFERRNFTFDGECFIEIQATKDTNVVQLHQKNLFFGFAEYYRKDSPQRTALKLDEYNESTNIMDLNFDEVLQANVSYILHFIYNGYINKDAEGMYRLKYTTSNNITKWFAATSFERDNARLVFPCFDEPNFKATFDLSLTRHRSLQSSGPTRLIGTSLIGEYVTDVYATTPKMSTYTLGFVVSQFIERFDGEFGVVTRPEYYSKTEYSFEVGKKILKAYDEYFGIPYYSMGNDKMQLVAVNDFSEKGRDNWGLIITDENMFLYDEEHSTMALKKEAGTIITHELTHMWFGNLVTMDWWNSNWLKEGFANYFQHFGLHMVESSFRMDQMFVIDQIHFIMEQDASKNAVALNATNNIHDDTTYKKGGSFIRMVKHILGEEKFQISIREYLKTHQYSNTVPSDLFTIWKKYWPEQFTRYADSFLASFTTQVGYPVVTFNRTAENNVQVTQKRFVEDTSDRSLFYTVPITYTTSDEKDFQNTSAKFFLEKTPIQIAVHNDTKWIMGNIQVVGYYRVNYDEKSWQRIKQSLQADNWGEIHELHRAQIVDDLFSLAFAGDIDYSLLFNVIEYLETETNYLPWSRFFHQIKYFVNSLGNDIADFARYIRFITEKVYKELGFDERKDDTPFDIYNRALVMEWACKFGNTDCISKAKSYFNKDLTQYPVPINIRSVVYCTAVREGNEQDIEKLYNKYKTEKDANEKELILLSLPCLKDQKLMSGFFNFIESADAKHKTAYFLHLPYLQNEGIDILLDFVLQNFEQIEDSKINNEAVFETISSCITNEDQLNKLTMFVNKNKDKHVYLPRILSKAQLNFNLSKMYATPLRNYLQQRFPLKIY